MFAFGASITRPAEYERYAARGFRLAGEPDSVVLPQPAAGSIFASYNAILDAAASHEDLEALALVHQDVEIVDRRFCEKVRAVLRDPAVGVIGCVAAVGVRSIAWWEGAVTWASFIHRYPELGGGEFPSLTWDQSDLPPYARRGEAETVDGLLMVLAPWAVRRLRFDEGLGQRLHGYDFDMCAQVREAGGKVYAEDLRVVHHHSLALVDDPEPYVDAHVGVAEKWDGRLGSVGWAPGDWKERARRAEAEESVTRAQVRAWQLQVEIRRRRHERAMAELRASTSLRLVAPLRRLRARRASAA